MTIGRTLRGFAAALVLLAGCKAPPPAPTKTPPAPVAHDYTLNLQGKVDVLFMVDNSHSMDAMSAQLRDRFPQFLAPFLQVAMAKDQVIVVFFL